MLSNVPQYLKDAIKGEPVDFIVQSSHDYVKRYLGLTMLIGSGLLSPILIYPLLFSLPLIQLLLSGYTQIIVNGTLETYTKANPWGAILLSLYPSIITFIFIIPILVIFKKGIKFFRKKGPWYAGTNNYLIEFDGNTIDYYKWSEFENIYQTKINKDSMDIILSLKKDRIDIPLEADDINNQILNNVQITVNGKQIKIDEKQKKHMLFMNKIGLLGIQNGGLILNMIKHNMERYHEAKKT